MSSAHLGIPPPPEEIVTAPYVSRETIARLERYMACLLRRQQDINLVGASTLADPWRRHFYDSAQLYPMIAPGARVLDIGSGAGFPGMVLAILGRLEVHLLESDTAKCAFLSDVAEVTRASVSIHKGRAETADLGQFDVVTARAVAPLDRLLGLALRYMKPGGECLFLKGKSANQELTDARRHWHIECQFAASLTDSRGQILRITKVLRA